MRGAIGVGMASNNVLKFKRPPKKPDPNAPVKPSPIVAAVVAALAVADLAAIYLFMR